MNIKKILHFSIGPIGSALLSLITLPFVAWFFSVEDVGRLTMLQIVLALSVTLFSMELHQAYVREYNEEEDKGALLKHAALPGLVLFSLLSILFVFSPWSISKLLFDIDSGFLSLLLLFGIFCSYIINFLAHVVRMEERGLAFSATQILPKLSLLFFIGLIFLLDLNADFENLMVMNILSIGSSLCIFAWLTKKTWLNAIGKSINKELLNRMFGFSLPLVAGGMSFWGLTTMDRLFLRTLTSFEELGVYALSVSIAGTISVVASIFSNLWHPVLYKWVKEGIDKGKVLNLIEVMTFSLCFIWSLVGALSFILLYFLPKEYAGVEYLVVACIAIPIFTMWSETTGVGIGITRRSSFSMFASLLAFLVNAVLNYILIPYFGASGAAISTLIAFFIIFIVRTEATAKIWWSFPRWKVYFLATSYVITTIVMVLAKAKFEYLPILWLLLFMCASILYGNILQAGAVGGRKFLLKFKLQYSKHE
ncbi:lipopolysaccharide biosynthesis protein [Aeromonas allosaccharophila]|uniref:lipopolysaccharide biosynthesis protein n=1 Tax=Aeromonas allosaccharophila TaxID=656 RepID=UPI003D1F957E